MNIYQATQKWVSQFNEIPTDVVEIVKSFAKKNGDVFEKIAGDEPEYGSYGLPSWGYMWTFDDWTDREWALNNLEAMAACGFIVYKSDHLGIVFGVDGGGYDFYDEHWMPLYKARGLKWHE